MNLRNLAYGLPVLLVAACSDTPDRYADVRALELPPELPVSHTRPQPVVSAADMTPKASPLAGLVSFEDDGSHPKLTIMTRPERAWDMVAVALKISNIEVVDKNRKEDRFQVYFDPDTAGKEGSFFDIFSDDNYPEAEYTIRLKEGILGIAVEAAPTKPDQIEPGKDGSAELVRFLHKTIDEKIINRDRSKDKDGDS